MPGIRARAAGSPPRWEPSSGAAGMSLPEMLVALSILATVLTSLTGVAISTFAAIRQALAQTAANQFANEVVETLHGRAWTDLVSPTAGPPIPPVVRGGVTFTASVTSTWVDNCGNGLTVPAQQDLLRLRVDVAWTTEGNHRRTLTCETLRSASADERPSVGGPSTCAA